MRYWFASLVLSLLLCASASLPAAAKSGDRARESWSDGEGSQQTRPHRQRLARASIADSYDSDDEARPRRRTYRHDGGSRPRIAKHRHARVARHMRRHQRTARKPGISRSKAAQQPQQPRAEGCVGTCRDDAAHSPQQGRRRQQPQARQRLARHGVLLLGATGTRLRRPLQPQRPDGRAQDAALRHPRARHAHGQRPLGRGQDQRPWTLCRRPHHRPVEGSRQRDRHDGQGVARVVVEVLGK